MTPRLTSHVLPQQQPSFCCPPSRQCPWLCPQRGSTRTWVNALSGLCPRFESFQLHLFNYRRKEKGLVISELWITEWLLWHVFMIRAFTSRCNVKSTGSVLRHTDYMGVLGVDICYCGILLQTGNMRHELPATRVDKLHWISQWRWYIK